MGVLVSVSLLAFSSLCVQCLKPFFTPCPRSLSIPPLVTALCKGREHCSHWSLSEKLPICESRKSSWWILLPSFPALPEGASPQGNPVCSQRPLHWRGERSELHGQSLWLSNSEKLHENNPIAKQNTLWASPFLGQNAGACLAYFYSTKHCLGTLSFLPMAGLLHRNIPWFSEFINLFFQGNEWRYSPLLNSHRNPLSFSVAILSGGCSCSRDTFQEALHLLPTYLGSVNAGAIEALGWAALGSKLGIRQNCL